MPTDHDSRAPAQPCRTPATDELFDAWDCSTLPQSRDLPDRYFTMREAREVFAAGLKHQTSILNQSIAMLGNGVGLMYEAAQLFRSYEAQHRAKAGRICMEHGAHSPECFAAREKTERNADIAARIEAFLLNDATPKDRVAGLALTLVQSINDQLALPIASVNAEIWDSWEELLGDDVCSAFERLRDALAGRVEPAEPAAGQCLTVPTGEFIHLSAADSARVWANIDKAIEQPVADAYTPPAEADGVKCMDLDNQRWEQTREGDLIGFGERAHFPVYPSGGPILTLVVNGIEYRTQSTSVRGKLGGCPIRLEWDGTTDLRVHIDTPGYVPPPVPPIIYGEGMHAADPIEEVIQTIREDRQLARRTQDPTI